MLLVSSLVFIVDLTFVLLEAERQYKEIYWIQCFLNCKKIICLFVKNVPSVTSSPSYNQEGDESLFKYLQQQTESKKCNL